MKNDIKMTELQRRLARALDRESAANEAHRTTWSIFEATRRAHELATEAANATGAELLAARAERVAAGQALEPAGRPSSARADLREGGVLGSRSLGGTGVGDNSAMDQRAKTMARER